ncbi:MAG: hypothetical protein J6Y62_04070, partial [Clostridia bacterium]|nr:hypothetical protein [Clostridia bacterium]
MPADILDQLNEARNEAIYDQDNALVQRIDALVSTLQNNASRLDIGREYLNALSRDGQSFDIREFMRFADRMERLPQEIVNSIVQSDRTENIVRNLMRPENMRRFAQISQNMPVQNLTRRGQISFVENASSVGASSDEGRRIFESVVAAFERQGRNFSNAAAEITARLERLSQFEQRRVQLQQHESRMMGEVQRVRGPVPGGWKASETAYRRMEAAKRLHEQGVRTEEVEREADIAMTFQTAADTRGLTRAEKRKVREFQEAYDNAATLEEREKAEKGLKGEMENFGTAKRSITMVDSALLGVDETMERLTDNMRDFCKGTPKGWQAIGFGIAFAAKELSAFVHSMSDAIVNMAELDVQAGKARANLESMFGAKVYDKFRDALDLTRREMIDFSRTAMDAYRANGVEMEKTMLVAGNIKEAFGQLDTSRLQEAVSIMSELTAGQTDALMGAA